MKVKLYAFFPEPELPPLYAAQMDAGSDGLIVLGEREQLEALRTRLDALLSGGKADGEIDHFDERLGRKWITIAEAVALARESGRPLSATAIRAACARHAIGGAKCGGTGERGGAGGQAWRMPQARFLDWLRSADAHRRGRPPASADAEPAAPRARRGRREA